MRVLIAIHDRALLEDIAYRILGRGQMVLTAVDGYECVEIARSLRPDIAIVDADLPGLDGYTVCREIDQVSASPIVLIIPYEDAQAAANAFEAGADEIVVGAGNLTKLVAVVEKLLRRVPAGLPPVLVVGEIHLDSCLHELRIRGQRVHLARQPFRLLQLLMSQPGRAVTRDEIFRHIWGTQPGPERSYGNTLEVYIRKLRQAVEDDPCEPKWLVNVKGVGYRFEASQRVESHG